MSHLIALVFDDQFKAEEARAALHRMAGEGLLDIKRYCSDHQNRSRQDGGFPGGQRTAKGCLSRVENRVNG